MTPGNLIKDYYIDASSEPPVLGWVGEVLDFQYKLWRLFFGIFLYSGDVGSLDLKSCAMLKEILNSDCVLF